MTLFSAFRPLSNSPRATANWWLPLRTLGALAVLACGGDGKPPTGGTPPATTGSLQVTIAGIPGGAAAAVVVSGPGGYTRSLTTTETLSSLTPGSYSLTASAVLAAGDRYSVASTPIAAAVVAGGTASTSVSYALVSGSLALTLSGLPDGTAADVTVSGPNGFSRMLSAATVLQDLAPGQYTIEAASVMAVGDQFAPTQTSLSLAVPVGTTPVPVAVAYAIASGRLQATVAGLPQGITPLVVVTGPDNFRREVAPGDTLKGLVPGTYMVGGDPVAVADDVYAVLQPSPLTVSAGLTPVVGAVQYQLASGRLQITIGGLPAATNANVQVSGPGGYSTSLTESALLTGLTPGVYSVTGANVVVQGATYSAGTPLQVTVVASTTPAAAQLTYGITTGTLTVVSNGLSQSIPAAIVVTGPGGFMQSVTTTTSLTGLAPGTYTVTAGVAQAGVHSYKATPATQSVTVSASATPTQAVVTHALSSALLQLNITGLPGSIPANVTVTGPGGFSQSATGSALLTGLVAGTYTVSASTVNSGMAFYAPNPASRTVAVQPSTVAFSASVNYVSANGSLNVTINGLPGGTPASVTLTGPNSFSQILTASTLLSGLPAGTYSSTAAAVTSGSNTYAVTPATQLVNVGGGATSNLIVTYALSGGPPPPPPGMNLTIDGMHVQQTVQNYAGNVPLIAGKDGLLRVFGKASQANTATPAVRVRLYNGATLLSTQTITAPQGSVPTSIAEGTLNSSWNYLIPAATMQPGLKILVDVDPTNVVTESSETDNTFPVSGTALTMDVRTVPDFNIRFVPVNITADGSTGNVNSGNVNSFLAETKQVFPLNVVNASVRAPYTTSAGALQNNDGNGAWSTILSELNALRTADGSTSYYAGIAHTSYGSGIAGLGYVPGRATLSWDHLPSADGVVAHELGHNFGRFHAPCGGAGSPDPSYPYAGGLIGVYGYDIVAGTLKLPTRSDLMGYCSTTWISDYTYKKVIDYRAANPFASVAMVAQNSPRPGVLVWGRIAGTNLILEPAFEVVAPAALPAASGAHQLQLFGALNEPLLTLSFDGDEAADVQGVPQKHFAFVIPRDLLRGGALPTRIRLASQGRSVERRSAPTAAQGPPLRAERLSGNTIRVHSEPGAAATLVRDVATGEILSILRGGEGVIRTAARDVELVVSDGVVSRRSRLPVNGVLPPPRR